MTALSATIVFLFASLLAVVKCNLSKDELFSLTRDGFSRPNPDELFYGFLPVWPIVLLAIAASFFVVAIIAFLGYATGLCKSPATKFVSAVDRDEDTAY